MYLLVREWKKGAKQLNDGKNWKFVPSDNLMYSFSLLIDVHHVFLQNFVRKNVVESSVTCRDICCLEVHLYLYHLYTCCFINPRCQKASEQSVALTLLKAEGIKYSC